MSKYAVSGSTLSSCCTVDMSFNKTFDSMNITLGVEEVLASLGDILSDYDMISLEDFEKLLSVAGEIQSIAILRDAEKICASCDDPRACVNCENFAKIHGQW